MVQIQSAFALLQDLGVITIPFRYVHETCVSDFLMKHGAHFDYVNNNISDDNFSHPTRILKPGEKFHVRAWRQSEGLNAKIFPSVCIDFMNATDSQSCLLGVQGATVVFDQRREYLPKGRCYSSFDMPDNLVVGPDARRRFPGVDACWNNRFHFNLTPFDRECFSAGAFLSYHQVSDGVREAI